MRRLAVVSAALLIGVTAALSGCIFPDGDEDYGEHGYYHHDRDEEHHRDEHRDHHDEGRGGERHDDRWDQEHR